MFTIWNIEQLRPLEAIGRRHGITFTLRGGVAYRLTALLVRKPPTNGTVDLFDLVPFMSDIDLTHSGAREKTPILLDEIMREVPTAECFRWELHSEMEVRALSGGGVYSNLVPARMIEITGNVPNGLVDRAGGYDDIVRRNYRYYRDPRFRQSQRYRAGHDLDVFSALIFLQTLAQAGLSIEEYDKQRGWRNVEEVFSTHRTDASLGRLIEEHSYLRSRLRHLLISTAASYPKRAAFLQVAEKSGLSDWMKTIVGPSRPLRIEEPLLSYLDHEKQGEHVTLVDSDRLIGDTYRLLSFHKEWTRALLSEQPDPRLPKLGAGQTVLLISPELTVEPGESTNLTSSLGLQPKQIQAQEFVAFCLPEGALVGAGLHDKDLSAFMLVSEEAGCWTPFSLPAVVQRVEQSPNFTKISIRLNCLGLMAAAAAQNQVRVLFVLVAWERGAS